MVFATDTVTVALPDEAVRTHASVVVLFLVADAGCLSIEAIVLFFSDRNLLAGATDVDKISLLIVFVLHIKPPISEWFPNRRLHKKSVEGRPKRENDSFQLPTTLVGWVY